MRRSTPPAPVHGLARAKIEARLGRLLVSVAVGGMIVALAPSAASANTTAKVNTFTFTGALVGTLKITPYDCQGGVASSYSTDFDDLKGKLRGSKADDWNIMIVTSKGNGTYKLHHGYLAGVQVNPEPDYSSGGDSSWLLWSLPIGMVGVQKIRRRGQTLA